MHGPVERTRHRAAVSAREARPTPRGFEEAPGSKRTFAPPRRLPCRPPLRDPGSCPASSPRRRRANVPSASASSDPVTLGFFRTRKQPTAQRQRLRFLASVLPFGISRSRRIIARRDWPQPSLPSRLGPSRRLPMSTDERPKADRFERNRMPRGSLFPEPLGTFPMLPEMRLRGQAKTKKIRRKNCAVNEEDSGIGR